MIGEIMWLLVPRPNRLYCVKAIENNDEYIIVKTSYDYEIKLLLAERNIEWQLFRDKEEVEYYRGECIAYKKDGIPISKLFEVIDNVKKIRGGIHTRISLEKALEISKYLDEVRQQFANIPK